MLPLKSITMSAAVASLLVLGAGMASADNVITVNAAQIFGTIDPAKINDYSEYMAGVNKYEVLTTLDGAGAIQPLLAENWTASDDGLTWTFTLKEGMTFQDGSPIEAKDVVWSVDRLLTINEGPAYLFEGVLSASGVTEVGTRKVQFVLEKTYPVSEKLEIIRLRM